MAIVAMLLSVSFPRYWGSLNKSKEAILRQDLSTMRDAVDKFYGDTGTFPGSLDELVDKQYLRSIPEDPITESATSWILISPPAGENGAVNNIRSGALGVASDGSEYGKW